MRNTTDFGGGVDLTMRKAEYTTLLAVGMTWPPPLWRGSCAITASRILNLTFLMAEDGRDTELWQHNTEKGKKGLLVQNFHNAERSGQAENSDHVLPETN